MGRAVRSTALAAIAALTVALPAEAAPRQEPANGLLQQVGHDPLFKRGMNAALAIQGSYAYVGSRTDGGHEGEPHGGVLVVDIRNARKPRVLGEPFDARPGESSRELRVWRSQGILIVLNTNCGVGEQLHHCTQPSISNFRFYDISGRKARSPELITQFDVDTHEFYLWQDPQNPRRALMYGGNAGSTCRIRGGSPSCPLAVWDISPVVDGGQPVTLYAGEHGYTEVPGEAGQPALKPQGGLHSLSISNDGNRAFYALLSGGFAVADVSDFAAGRAAPQPRPITLNEARPTWPGPGAHSAVKFWNRDYVWITDEVYGEATGPAHGCPWGWARVANISDPQRPRGTAEFRLPQNFEFACGEWEPRPRTSYSAHNPTLTPRVALTSWHSGGLVATDIEDPRRPRMLSQFLPRPLDEVMLEDPRLSSDPDTGNNEKVVMWSYPIIHRGLIYVTDVRNGFYVLKYRGRFEREIRRVRFLEGNSNQGDALCFEPVGRAPAHCR